MKMSWTEKRKKSKQFDETKMNEIKNELWVSCFPISLPRNRLNVLPYYQIIVKIFDKVGL